LLKNSKIFARVLLFYFLFFHFRNDDLLIHQLSYALVSLDLLTAGMKRKLADAYMGAKRSLGAQNLFSLVDQKEYLASGVIITFPFTLYLKNNIHFK
jgi:hypothetical protein